MIIALTGKKLSGKTTIAEYLHAKHQAATYRFSQPLSDILERLHQENTRNHLVQLGIKLRTIFGDDMLAHVIRKDIQASSAELHVIDGLRYIAEYEALQALPHFRLMYIDVDRHTRYTRMAGRSEKADEAEMSFEEFEKREADATEIEIALLEKYANYVVPNTGTLDELYTSIDQILEVE